MQASNNTDILLIEDNEDQAEITMRALRKHNVAGQIHWLKDGAEAVEFIFGTGSYAGRDVSVLPHMILLDLKLPKLDGLEVLARIKADPRMRTVPVVMMTSSQEPRDMAESYRLGVNSYVVKPIDYMAYHTTVGRIGQYWQDLNRVPS